MFKLTYKSIFFSTVAVFVSTQALAVEIQCNRRQSKCITYNSGLTIGDRVGVFNRSDELVAVGKVKSMEGPKRSVKIFKRYGTIYKGHTVALLGRDVRKISQVEEEYAIYSPYSDKNYGVNVGIASFAVGEYLAGTEVTGHGQKVAYKHLDYVLRGTLVNATGKISRGHAALGVETKELYLFGIGIMPGLAATALEQNLVSFRAEIGAGFMYAVADVDGDSSLIEGHGFNSKFTNGFNPVIRAALSVQFNMTGWRTEVVAAQSVVREARVSTIGLGLSKDID